MKFTLRGSLIVAVVTFVMLYFVIPTNINPLATGMPFQWADVLLRGLLLIALVIWLKHKHVLSTYFGKPQLAALGQYGMFTYGLILVILIATRIARYVAGESHPAWLIINAWLLFPMIEEILFRGLLLTYLLNKMRAPAAWTVSSLVFALLHLNYGVLIAGLMFLQAIALCYLVAKTRSLWPGIAIHIAYNI